MDPSVWLWFWIGLAVLLSVAEMFTAGFFLLPFGIGAAVAALLEFVWPGSIGWQWVAFVGFSSLLLIGLRQFAESITHDSPQGVAADRLIGKTGTVIEGIEEHGHAGRVRVEREEWGADAPGHGSVAPGAQVEVVSVEGTHLIVRPRKMETTGSNEA